VLSLVPFVLPTKATFSDLVGLWCNEKSGHQDFISFRILNKSSIYIEGLIELYIYIYRHTHSIGFLKFWKNGTNIKCLSFDKLLLRLFFLILSQNKNNGNNQKLKDPFKSLYKKAKSIISKEKKKRGQSCYCTFTL
jgi:hypothetical protein